MASKTELERLAAATYALRPDWPLRSVLTYLEREHSARAYRDLAVALAYIATDPTTVTPKRLGEAGPWWRVTHDVDPIRFERCPKPGHTSYPAHNCGACRVDALEPSVQQSERVPGMSAERVRQILDAALDEPRRPVDHAEAAAGDAS